MVNAGVNTQYTYNGDGDRLAQIVTGVTTKYALDPTGLAQVLIETTSGQSTHYLPGLAQYGGNAWNYYLPDRLGSVRQLTDPSGAVMLARSYDPFGNGLEQTGGGQSVFGYTGEQTDPTGLVFLRARYYNPALGRFLTADSVVPDPLSSVGWNRYAYVYDNPTRYTDPTGKNPLCLFLIPADGPAPVGDAICVALIGYTILGGAAILQNWSSPFPLNAPDSSSPPPYELGNCPNPMTSSGPTLMVPPYTGPVVPPFSTGVSVPIPNIWESKVIQTGGRTIYPETARKLNEYFGLDLHPRDWGRALERLKKDPDLQLPNNHHGNIEKDGTYTDQKGNPIGNIADYLP